MPDDDRTMSLPPAPPGGARAPRHEPLTLAEFLAEPVQRRAWAVEGVWPEGASGVIAGSPKAGKSTLCMELAVTLATGADFMGQPEFALRRPPARVGYVQAENSKARVRRDLDAIVSARRVGGRYEDALPEWITREQWDDYHRELADDESYEPPLPPQRFVPELPDGREPHLEILSNPDMNLNVGTPDMGWLTERAGGLDYLLLDPLYLLSDANVNDTNEMTFLLRELTRLRDQAGCAVIITHQMTDKSRSGSAASRMIGSTFLHGWYEAAIFTSRSAGGVFTIDCDNLREMSEERRIAATGTGVGHWFMAPAGEPSTDDAGRAAPRVDGAAANKLRLQELEADEPGLSAAAAGERLGLSEGTVNRYRRELRAMAEGSE